MQHGQHGMHYRHKRVQALQEREPGFFSSLFASWFPSPTTSTTTTQAAPTTLPQVASPTTIGASNPETTTSNAGDPSTPTSTSTDNNSPTSTNNADPAPSTTAPSSPTTTGSSNNSSPNSSDDTSGSSGSSDTSGASDSGSSSTTGPVINADGGQAYVTSSTTKSSPTTTGGSAASGTTAGDAVTSIGGTGYVTGGSTESSYPIGTGTIASTTPSEAVNSATSTQGVSKGVITAIVVVVVAVVLTVILCCIRRRAILTRVRRRKEWANNVADGEKNYSDKDGAFAAGSRSARSSFATHFDRGQMITPAPVFEHADPFQTVVQPWPSELVTAPLASHPVSSAASPTVRNPDRSSVHSASSASGRPTSKDSQYLIGLSPPPAAASKQGIYSLEVPPSPFDVRPFSPSETFAFPKPPQHDAQSRAASEILSSSVKSSRHGSAFYTAEELPSASAENENPFADFMEVASVNTENSVPAHFAPVETIRRPFVPSMEDEMGVSPGELVRIIKRFDDGWAIAEKIAGKTQGLIPIDCLREVEEELPAFLAKKRISSYRASVVSGASGATNIGAAM